MFKHGFPNKRSLPQRWDLERVRETRPFLSAEGPESDGNSQGKSKPVKHRTEPETDESMTRAKEVHQQSTYSQDSCWTLNTELDRVSSSLASWDEDEFEKETSRRVEALLQELDAALYEGAPLDNKQLQEECAEWAAKFPYLRVVGKQVVPPGREKGYSYHASSYQPTRRPQRTSTSATPKELSLVGRRLKPTSTRYSEDDERTKATVIEEVLAQGGVYEEYLAVDRSADDEEEYSFAGQCTSGSILQSRPFEGQLKSELVDALFETLWPDLEKTLIERRSSATGNDSLSFTDRRHLPTAGQELPPTMLSRCRSRVSPVARKRVLSTALATYGSQISEGRSKIPSSVSRTAPAVFRGRPPSANVRDSGAGPLLRNSRFTKLPPIEPTAPYLPNVPALKSQVIRAADPMSKVSEHPLDDDEEELIDSMRKVNVMPPLMDTKIVKSTQSQSQDLETTGADSAAAAVARNMNSMRIGKRQPVDSKTHSKVAKHINVASDGRRARTGGLGGDHNSLVIQGYQQWAFTK